MMARGSAEGFTIVELMMVVLVIGILVAVAIPLFVSSRATAAERVCFANQRMIEGAVSMWAVRAPDNEPSDLEGVVDASHPLIVDGVIARPPRCTGGADPADSSDPTPAEGAYTLDDEGTIEDCSFGILTPHGRYQ